MPEGGARGNEQPFVCHDILATSW